MIKSNQSLLAAAFEDEDKPKIDKSVLLGALRDHVAGAPDLPNIASTDAGAIRWAGRAAALVRQWDPVKAIMLESHWSSLISATAFYAASKPGYAGKILTILHNAIASLEIELGGVHGAQVFQPGQHYDVHKAITGGVALATASLMIVDPYLDETVVDRYLVAVQQAVGVRLLAGQYAAKLKPAANAFAKQHGVAIELRKAPPKATHDRVLVVDGKLCFVLGQSIKDAAQASMTYLASLDPEASALKAAYYQAIWDVSQPA